MLPRGPDGQFLSHDEVVDYRDFEFQHVSNKYSIAADELPAAFPILEEDITAVKLDDLLHREERADLVAVMVHTLQGSVSGTSSAESALEVNWELNIGNGSNLTLENDRDTTDNAGNSGVVTIESAESDDPNTLYHGAWVAEGGFSDTATGVAAGPDQAVIDADVHYPRDYGACPRLDDRDEITESFHLNFIGGADITDSRVELRVSYTLVFAVHDDDH